MLQLDSLKHLCGKTGFTNTFGQSGVLKASDEKGNTRKSDEGTPVSLPQWSGDWRAAREQLVTDDFRWVERARTCGLPVESETGRWKGVPKELRKCACGAKIGTPMHAIEKCPLFDTPRGDYRRSDVFRRSGEICG